MNMKTDRLRIPSLAVCAIAIVISSYASPVPVHRWSGEGNANDTVGDANGTIITYDSNLSAGVTFTTGQVDQAFSFDGNGVVDCGTTNVAAFGDQDFAISFWMKGSTDGFLVGKTSYG